MSARHMGDGQLLRHRLSILTAVAALVLVVAGGLVTSTGSGLAVPDWPLSFGQLFPPMTGGVFYEHGHRVIAAAVGVLALALAVSIGVRERRPWPRRLAAATVAVLVVQTLLGGMTVLRGLPLLLSVAHACVGQVFLALLVALSAVSAPTWTTPESRQADRAAPSLRALSLWTCIAVFLQLLLGAIVRHMGAGLAIPDFPLSFGHLLPPVWNAAVAVHFLHRIGSLAVAAMTLWVILRLAAERRGEAALWSPAVALSGLLAAQIYLGAATVWSRRAVWATTAHVGVGAAILSSAVLLAAGAYRLTLPREKPAGDLVRAQVTAT